MCWVGSKAACAAKTSDRPVTTHLLMEVVLTFDRTRGEQHRGHPQVFNSGTGDGDVLVKGTATAMVVQQIIAWSGLERAGGLRATGADTSGGGAQGWVAADRRTLRDTRINRRSCWKATRSSESTFAGGARSRKLN